LAQIFVYPTSNKTVCLQLFDKKSIKEWLIRLIYCD